MTPSSWPHWPSPAVADLVSRQVSTELGIPISAVWFFLFVAVALVIDFVIYQGAGNLPYRP